MKKILVFIFIFYFSVALFSYSLDCASYTNKFFIEGSYYFNQDGTLSNKKIEDKVYEFKGNSINILLKSDFDSSIYRAHYTDLSKKYTNHDIDQIVSDIRSKSLDYYSNIRKEFNNKFKIMEETDVQISSPYIELYSQKRITKLTDLDSKYKKIIKDSQIEYLSVVDVYHEIPYSPVECVYSNCGGTDYITPDPNPFKPENDFVDLLDTINATDIIQYYHGDGVKIGIWEVLEKPGSSSGKINPYHPQLTGNVSATYYNKSSYAYSLHATQVAIVAAGYNGIAKNSLIYAADYDAYSGNIIDLAKLQWFADNNVSVVNMSFGRPWISSYNTILNSRANAYDKFVRDNLIILVAATGDPGDAYMGPPALAYNVIAVGATVFSGEERAAYSIYLTPNSLMRIKPNMVAIGNMNIPSSGYNEGTSFAAPLVTGAIALGIENDQILRLFPEKVFSVLAATSNIEIMSSSSFETNTYHNEYGSGLLDISAFINNLVANQTSVFQTIGYPSGVEVDIYETSITASISDPKRLTVSLNWLVSVVNNQVKLSDYNLYVYLNNQLIGVCNSTFGNMEIFSKIISENGVLRFAIQMNGSFIGSVPDLIALSWNIK